MRTVASVCAVLALVAGVPLALVTATRRRYGGSAPWHGVDPPSRWSRDAIRDALAARLDDAVLVDVVVRLALGVAWVAVAVLALTVVAETVHMARHGGLAMPAVRGLGWSQRLARAIAVGLLLVAPLASMSRVQARPPGAPALRPAAPAAAVVHVHASDPAGTEQVRDAAPASDPAADVVAYVVTPGDSIYAIAGRLAGGEPSRTATIADAILDLNLGTVMRDGQRFVNAAYIEVGWVLQVPVLRVPASHIVPVAAAGEVHVVQPGETLSAIALARLGAPERWTELWHLNAGHDMGGRTFDDPNLILPGWALLLPTAAQPSTAPGADGSGVATTPDAPYVAPVSEPPEAPTVAQAVDAPVPTAPVQTSPSTQRAPRSASVVAAGEEIVPTTSTARMTASEPDDGDGSTDDAPPTAPAPIGLGGGAMLAAGLLAVLAARRRRRLRAARPRARVPRPPSSVAETERLLRTVSAAERLARLDIAIRAVARPIADAGRRVLGALVDGRGEVNLVLDDAAELPAPWHGDGARWRLPASVALEVLAASARDACFPCATLVQLGVAPGERDVFVDLEAMGVLAVDAPEAAADAVVAAIATTLASSAFAEVAHLVGVGVDERAFLGHGHAQVVECVDDALEVAAALLGTTTSIEETTFALRTRRASGESWEPAVVLIAAARATHAGTALPACAPPGLAVVAGSAVDAAPHVLVGTGSTWRLEPLGIDLVPIGLTPDEVGAVATLVAQTPDDAPDVDDGAREEPPSHDPSAVADLSVEPAWMLLVRLLGPVDVVDRELRPVALDRSKTRELIAWLATHRQRATRTAARTALWEMDVRDATFANIVSEARRAMARLVPPPGGTEWLPRTLTEELRLDPEIVTDVDLVAARLAASRGLPPAAAVDVLEPAVAMIRGMPFEATSYLWPDAEGITSSLVLLATSAAAELAALHLTLGDIAGVFRATGRGLRVLPGHEELIALRMRAHARAGDLAGVRQEWASYERAITADAWSDGEPAPKLLSLRRELLSPSA